MKADGASPHWEPYHPRAGKDGDKFLTRGSGWAISLWRYESDAEWRMWGSGANINCMIVVTELEARLLLVATQDEVRKYAERRARDG